MSLPRSDDDALEDWERELLEAHRDEVIDWAAAAREAMRGMADATAIAAESMRIARHVSIPAVVPTVVNDPIEPVPINEITGEWVVLDAVGGPMTVSSDAPLISGGWCAPSPIIYGHPNAVSYDAAQYTHTYTNEPVVAEPIEDEEEKDMTTKIRSYAEGKKFLDGRSRKSLPEDADTMVMLERNTIHVFVDGMQVVQHHRNGEANFYYGGNITQRMRNRLNACSPDKMKFTQEDFVQYLAVEGVAKKPFYGRAIMMSGQQGVSW